ncbi:MAG TPA: TMEM175 family protein [Actinomycetota bacterium]
MTKNRLEAFSDAVIAIVITIMVLELAVPHDDSWGAFRDSVPGLAVYALSFVFLAIYWNNHHHLLHASERVNGRILWANMHLLFWLSLVPFVTAWMTESDFHATPVAVYGVVLILAAIAYYVLQAQILVAHGPTAKLRAALAHDVKGKVSPLLYAIAIPAAYVTIWISLGLYIFVALMWLVPDPRIESLYQEIDADSSAS